VNQCHNKALYLITLHHYMSSVTFFLAHCMPFLHLLPPTENLYGYATGKLSDLIWWLHSYAAVAVTLCGSLSVWAHWHASIVCLSVCLLQWQQCDYIRTLLTKS